MKNIKFKCFDNVAGVMFDRIEYIGFGDEVVHLRRVNLNSDDALMAFDGDRYMDKYGNYIDIDFEDVNILQCVGLRDKNGAEIYEGDIIQIENTNGEKYNSFVRYNQQTCSFVLQTSEYDHEEITDETGGLTIVGNIYENPELLK